MGDGILDGYPIIQDQTSPNLAHIPTTNLVTYSEDIDTWSKAGSVTVDNNNDISPSGVVNASLILPNAGTGSFGVINTISKSAASTTYCMSGFAKEKDYNFLILRIDSGAANGVKGAFDLSNGSISTAFSTNGSGFTLINAGISSYENGWYRFEVVLTTDSATLLRPIFYVSNVTGNGFSVPSYTANGTDGILMWGAQLEEQSQATAYIKSDGIASVRKATTTNLITYSEDFSIWSIDGNQSSPITISGLNPDGSSQVYQINLNSGGNIYKIINISSSTDYTFSVYIKGSGVGRLILSNAQSVPENYLDFTATSEWQRIELTGSSSYTLVRFAIGSWSNSAASGTIQIFGAQLEQQTQVETYAPTYGLPVTIDLFTENNYGTMTNMSASDIVPDTPNN
jgi:hypothetical protein